ncbi:MAG: hypothetical protein ACK5LY_01100 [Lachnospirales bacterium]
MKKIFAATLSIAMVASNVSPILAATEDLATQKLVFDTAKNTFDTIEDELYGGYYEEAESFSLKFLESIRDGHNINYSNEMTYGSNFFGIADDEGGQVIRNNFSYNDDGESILINSDMSYNEIFTENSFYIDNEKIAFKNQDTSVVYSFGDEIDLGDGTTTNIDFLKYDNIKKYVNILIDLELSGELDEIYDDYSGNLLDTIAKGDFSKNGDTVTVVVDNEIIGQYFIDLGIKFRDDENLKEIYNSLELPADVYGYNTVGGYVADLFYEVGTAILNDSFEIVYTGVIANDVFVENKVDITYMEETVTFELNFNGDNDALLEKGEFLAYSKNYYDSELVVSNFSFNETAEGKKFALDLNVQDEDVFDMVMTYKMDGLNYIVNSEINTYSLPYYYYTEKPVKEDPMEFTTWINSMENPKNASKEYISVITEENNLIDNEIAKVEKYIADGSTEEYVINSDQTFYWDIIYYDYSGTMGKEKDIVVDTEDDYYSSYFYEEFIITDMDLYLTALNGTKESNLGMISWEEEWLADSLNVSNEENYTQYLEHIERINQYELEEYERYIKFVASGRKYDVTTIKNTISQEIDEDKISTTSIMDTYMNDEFVYSQNYVMDIKNDFGKNEIDLNNAISFDEFIKTFEASSIMNIAPYTAAMYFNYFLLVGETAGATESVNVVE